MRRDMEYRRVYAKIDLDAIEHNIKLVKEKIPAQTKLALVVKADAYGHGAAVLAEEFEDMADFFAVAEMGEAVELRRHGIKKADSDSRLYVAEPLPTGAGL